MRYVPTQNSTRMDNSNLLHLEGALQLVRRFCGDSLDQLECFLDSVASAKRLLRLGLEEHFLDGTKGSSWKGSAHKQLKRRTVKTFNQLTDELESLFGITKNIILLQVEFTCCSKKKIKKL